jgi:hypothetical protein
MFCCHASQNTTILHKSLFSNPTLSRGLAQAHRPRVSARWRSTSGNWPATYERTPGPGGEHFFRPEVVRLGADSALNKLKTIMDGTFSTFREALGINAARGAGPRAAG